MPDRSNMTYLGVAPVTVDERSGEATFKRSDIRYSPEFGGFAGTPSREAILNTGAAWGNYSGSPATEEWWEGAAGSEPWGVSPYAMHDGSFGDLPGYDADDPYAESLGMDLVDNDFGMDLVENDFGEEDDVNISEELLEGRLAGFGDWYPNQESTADLPWSEGAYATQDGGTSFGEVELETASWAEGMVNMNSTGSEPWDVPVGDPSGSDSFGRTNKANILLGHGRKAKGYLGNNLQGKVTSTSTKNIASVAVPMGAMRLMKINAKLHAAKLFKKAGLFSSLNAAKAATRSAQVVRRKSGQRWYTIGGPPMPFPPFLPIPMGLMIVRIPKTGAQTSNSSGTTGQPAPTTGNWLPSPGGGSAQPGISQVSNVHGSLALWQGSATDALAAADSAHQSWAGQGITVRSPYAVYDMGGGSWEVEGTVQTQGGIDAPVQWDESLFQGTPSREAILNTGAAWGNYSGHFGDEHDEYEDEY